MEVGGGAAGEDGKEVAPMTKKRWRDHITQCCKDAGTYKPYFDDVIEYASAFMSVKVEITVICEAHRCIGIADSLVFYPEFSVPRQ